MENLGQKRRMGFQRLDDDVSDKHFISIVGALVDLLLEGGVIHLWGSHQSDISQFIKRCMDLQELFSHGHLFCM